MRLQYQESNGRWYDCGGRTEEFLDRCVRTGTRFGPHKNRAEVIAALEAGKVVCNDVNCWYAMCRDGEAYDRWAAKREADQKAAEAADTRETMRCKQCGRRGKVGDYPFSTCPDTGLCDDCL